MSDLLSIQTIRGQEMLVYRYRSASDIDDIIIQLINESRENGFLRMNVLKKERLLAFQTEGLLPLSAYVPGSAGEEDLLRVLKELYSILFYLEDSFIDAQLAVMDESAVYIDEQDEKLYLAVLPDNGISDSRSDLTSFLLYLLDKFGRDASEEFREDVRERICGGLAALVSLGDLVSSIDQELHPVRVKADPVQDDILFMDEDREKDEDTVFSEMDKNSGEDQPESQAFLLRRSSGEIIMLPHSPYIIGKVPLACDYVVGNNPALSRIHAIIRYDRSEDQYYIIDCGSTNHIYLNGIMIEDSLPSRLMDGMQIFLANERFDFIRRTVSNDAGVYT